MKVADMLPALAETQIAEYSPTAARLAELRERLSDVAYDVSTGKGMEIAKRDRAEVRDLRVALERKRVELKAPALERSRMIDAEAKRITAELEELERPIDEQIKAEESRKEEVKQARINAEFGRVQAIQDAIAELHMEAMIASGKPSAFIAEALVRMKSTALDPAVFQEMLPQAQAAHQAAIAKLELAHKAKLHDEAESARIAAERVELEQLRAAAAEQKRKDEAAAVEIRRVEAERLATERKAVEEEQRAARLKIEQEEAQARAQRAEADRLAAAERAAQQKRIDEERAEMRRKQDEADAKERAARLAKEEKERAKRMKAEAAEKQLRDAAPVLLAALQGLLVRHGDGSAEAAWAEWDTALAAVKASGA